VRESAAHGEGLDTLSKQFPVEESGGLARTTMHDKTTMHEPV
jgi:hypothetical protein